MPVKRPGEKRSTSAVTFVIYNFIRSLFPKGVLIVVFEKGLYKLHKKLNLVEFFTCYSETETDVSCMTVV